MHVSTLRVLRVASGVRPRTASRARAHDSLFSPRTASRDGLVALALREDGNFANAPRKWMQPPAKGAQASALAALAPQPQLPQIFSVLHQNILGIKKSSWFFKLSSLCKKILSPHRVTVTCNCTRSRSLSTATPWFCKFFTSNKKQHARAITMHSIGACASSSTLLCVTVCTHATHSSPFCSLFCTIVHSTN